MTTQMHGEATVREGRGGPQVARKAVLTGHYEGVLTLVVGAKLNNLVAGEGFEPSTFGL